MRFKILGLLEVSEGGRVIPLPRGKERALLAALLIRAHEPVSTDRLIEDLWGESSPEHAAKTVQVYVSRLRKALGAERLQTTPGGYLLHVAEGELDSDDFERLVRAGHEALEAGDLARAERVLGQAATLWRGPALADFRFERFAQTQIRRLDELCAAMKADLVDVRLERGQTTAVIPELEQLVGENPLWERPRRQLMLALYRTGRQADALELYRRTRTVLDDELGIEPSAELQELERAILNHDPTLAGPPRRLPRATARRGALLLLAGGLAIAAATGVAAFELTRSGSSGSRTAGGGSGAGNAIAAIRGDGSVSYTDVGTTPTAVAVGEGAVWVLNADDRTVSRIDLETKDVRTFGTGRIVTDLAVGEGALWVGNGAESGALGNFYTRSVTRLDPRSTAPVHTAVLPGRVSAGRPNAGEDLLAGASQIAAGAGAVWAINPDLSVSRIDEATGNVVARVPIEAAAIAAGRSAVWALKRTEPEVVLIDRRRNRVGRTFRLPADSLWGLAVGGGSAWATDFGTGVLWRIGANTTPMPIDVGFGITSVAYGAGAVWVVNFVTDELTRVDPRTNKVVSRFRLTGTPPAVAADEKTAWVSVAGAPSGHVLPGSTCGAVEAGGREPDLLIASDLPLQGPNGGLMRVTADAIRFVLQTHGFRAGTHAVGYQSCDDSTGQTGRSDLVKCASNAKTYAAAERLVGVIGPWVSTCAGAQIPIANRADGPLPMISPSTTHPGLTHRTPGSDADQPRRFYPTGVRNYFRVTGSSDLDGAAGAVLAHELGLRRVFVLRSDAGMGDEATTPFRQAARRLGIRVVGSSIWHARAADYRSLAARVAAARPDGVYIGDEVDANGGKVVRALRTRLGSKIVLIAGDGFLPTGEVLAGAGRAAIGMYITTPAVAHEGLGPAGRRFVREFGRTQSNGITPSAFYVTEAAQAAEVLLAAIARSDGTRASVLEELRRLEIKNGILGSFRFDRNGDITPASSTVFRITGGRKRAPELPEAFVGAVVDRVVRVPPALGRP